MTFQEAKKKLAEMAGGKYYSIKYEEVTASNRQSRVICTAYIDGHAHTQDCPTWEASLDCMQRMLDGRTLESQAPE